MHPLLYACRILCVTVPLVAACTVRCAYSYRTRFEQVLYGILMNHSKYFWHWLRLLRLQSHFYTWNLKTIIKKKYIYKNILHFRCDFDFHLRKIKIILEWIDFTLKSNSFKSKSCPSLIIKMLVQKFVKITGSYIG